MTAGKYVAVCILASILVLHCGKSPVAPSLTTGSIKGKIVSRDSISTGGILVVLQGTNFMATTDSAGNYLFCQVPEGKYRLGIWDIWYGEVIPIDSAAIISGDTVTISDFVIKQGMSYYLDNKYLKSTLQIDSVEIFGDTGSLLGDMSLDYYTESPVAFVTADSAYFYFIVTRLDAGSYTQHGVAESTIVSRNGSIIYAGRPSKGRVTTGKCSLTGADTFKIYVDGDSIKSFIVSDPANLKNNYIHIFTGDVNLTPKPLFAKALYVENAGTVESASYLRYYAFFGNSCYEIMPDNSQVEVVDWDIYLVNDTLNDTCYWGNPRPEWGSALTTDDNPFFYGDGKAGNYGWYPDEITSHNLPAGRYSVYLKFYESHPDGITATPTLNIALANHYTNSMLEKFYQLKSPRPMRKGEVWHCGELLFPEKLFAPADTSGAIQNAGGLLKRS
jgi:hypothetical protein